MRIRANGALGVGLAAAIVVTGVPAAYASTHRPAAGAVAEAGTVAPVPAVPQAVPAYARADLPTADVAPDDVTVVEVPVVVAPVAATGELVETPEVAAAQETDDVVAADAVVGDRVVSEVVEPGEFQTLGLTWAADAVVGDVEVEVRTRADGQWSDWVPLETGETAPDAGTADAAQEVRGGTDSLWVGDAEAVQLSFPASPEGVPADLALAVVDVPDAPSEATSVAGAVHAEQASFESAAAGPASSALATALVVPAAGVEPYSAPAVPIITRDQWGARPQVCTPDVATTNGLVGAVVHHTAGSNTYATVEEAMRQIRGDQAYHIDGRGWCDLGYNFVVDKWGNVYEGRARSLTQPVIGVHAGGFNTGTVGVSMLGTYGSPPPAATTDAVGRIIGMRLAAYNIDPRGAFVYNTLGGENSKFAAGTAVPLPRVFGHRDVAYTACPGEGGWAAINQVRTIAGTYLDARRYVESGSVVKALYQDLLGRQPDPVGYQGWRSLLMTGSQTGLVDSLTQSDEYIDRRVRQAYREVLGREPDPAGAVGWRDAIRARRATVDAVQRTFYDSLEYFQISGGTPTGYVARLFETMLGRTASEAELRVWVDLYTSRGRTFVVDNIWWSAEAAQRRAGVYYSTFLGREPDLPGVQAWGRVLLAQGEGAVRIGIAGSDEYRQRAIQRYPS